MRLSPMPPPEGLFDVGPPTAKDVYLLCDDARSEDEVEWARASSGLYHLPRSFEELLLASVVSAPCGSVLQAIRVAETGKPLCIWGVHAGADLTLGGKSNVGWMVATNDAAERWALPLHRLMKQGLDKVDEKFPEIIAYADKDNRLHHMWMKWMGFEQSPGAIFFGDPVLGERYPFYEFIRRRPT